MCSDTSGLATRWHVCESCSPVGSSSTTDSYMPTQFGRSTATYLLHGDGQPNVPLPQGFAQADSVSYNSGSG